MVSSAVATSSKLNGKSKSGSSNKPLTTTQHEPETVDESESSEDDEEDEDDSIDSEDDIEAITPKKKATQASGSKTPSGKSLPKYVPPHGMIPANIDATFKDSPFEYDRLASNPSLQLWAIRVPADFKPSRLSALSFKPPTSSRKPSGTLKTKSTTYKLAAAGEPSTSKAVVDEEGRQPTAGARAADSMVMNGEATRAEGGEEMGGGMRLLVPRVKQNGALVVAPIPISQHLLLEPQIDEEPIAVDSSEPLPSYLSEGVPDASTMKVHMEGVLPGKRAQPSHLFKFRNRAFGYDTPGPAATVISGMDLDEEYANLDKGEEKAVTEAEPVKEKKKKRKSEGKDALASPKKSKKAKV